MQIIIIISSHGLWPHNRSLEQQQEKKVSHTTIEAEDLKVTFAARLLARGWSFVESKKGFCVYLKVITSHNPVFRAITLFAVRNVRCKRRQRREGLELSGIDARPRHSEQI